MNSDFLTDFSPMVLAQAAKANLHEFFCLLAKEFGNGSNGKSGIVRWHTQVPYPWFNGVLVTRPLVNGDGNLVDEIVSWFTSRSVSNFTFWLSPELPRQDWGSMLEAHGFQSTYGPPGMTVDLNRLRYDKNKQNGLILLPVNDEKTLEVWTHTFILGYGLPPSWEEPLFEMMATLGLDLPVRNYLGYMDDKPVSTSTLFLGAGLAGIYFVSTLPEVRGRGFGNALSLAPLLDAQKLGYRIGTLQSSEMGYPVYQKLGFQKVCQVDHYYWAGGGSSA